MTYIDALEAPASYQLLVDVIRPGLREVPGCRVVDDHTIACEWDVLLASFLSSTEKAAVRIASAFFTAESIGGAMEHLRPLIDAALSTRARSLNR